MAIWKSGRVGFAGLLCILFLGARSPAESPTAQPGLSDSPANIVPAPAAQVLSADSPSTMPVPLDLPEIEDLHHLMERIKKANREAGDKDPRKAAKGAEELVRLSRASLHPRLRVDDRRYDPLALQLYLAASAHQRALEDSPGDRRVLAKALKDVNTACNQCHKVLRPKEEESSRAPAEGTGPAGARPGSPAP